MVRRVAPHGRQVALLDRAKQAVEQVQHLEAELTGMGLEVRWLEVVELENFWLEPALIERIVRELADLARDHGREVEPPSLDEIREMIETRPEAEKGSDVFKEICARVHLTFNKKVAATIAMALIRELVPNRATQLRTAVEDAFR